MEAAQRTTADALLGKRFIFVFNLVNAAFTFRFLE
jgi:hypothetical protein